MVINEFIDDVKKNADTNKDGKTTAVEWITYLLKNPVFIIIGVILISINPIADFLIEGISNNEWDWLGIIKTVSSLIVLFLFYIFTKTSDKQYTNVIDKIKEEFTSEMRKLSEKIEKYKGKIDSLTEENSDLKGKVELQEYIIAHPNGFNAKK